MVSISPSGPLLSLVVKPTGDKTTQDLLALFHPIMVSLGFGHFEMEQNGFYIASKGGDGIFSNELFAFAEVDVNSVVINVDGHSIFGLKGVEQQLQNIKEQYENRGATATMLGPDYAGSLISNLIFTALPIYSCAFITMWMMYNLGGFTKSGTLNVLLYATIGVIGAKTRFWVNERRKQRALWKSILILLLTVPLALGIVVLVSWAISMFG